MTDCAPTGFLAFPMSDPMAPLSAAVAMADSIGAMLGAARALMRAGRAVDLSGLDELCGRLSARCLDLPPEQGRIVGSHLESLRNGLDQTTRLLAESQGRSV